MAQLASMLGAVLGAEDFDVVVRLVPRRQYSVKTPSILPPMRTLEKDYGVQPFLQSAESYSNSVPTDIFQKTSGTQGSLVACLMLTNHVAFGEPHPLSFLLAEEALNVL